MAYMLLDHEPRTLARMKTTPAPEVASRPLRFLRRGAVVSLANVPPSRTLLDVLREDLHLTATKEGCGEGDCGACTVVVGERTSDGLRYKAINSCIRLAHSVDGMAVWTAADLAGHDDPATAPLHPVQEAMVQCHGSQCGFCTPGFVMSLFAMYQNSAGGHGITREQAQADLSGNLCRCTGYRPILDAAQRMGELPLPDACRVDEAATLDSLAAISPVPTVTDAYLKPTNLHALLQARHQRPQAQLVAGCTDVGLWVTKQHRCYDQILDVTGTRELQQIETYPHHIAIGAAVNLADAFAALVAERPQLLTFSQRFAGLPVRNSGTLGGNVANGSPIGDSMPLLIALGASVILMRWKPSRTGGQVAHRELPLEDLYTGYRTNVMHPDEVLAWIKVPRPTPHELLRVYKISKRFDDDISAVCLAIRLELNGQQITSASIGAGGVAATPARARQTEAALRGHTLSADTVMAAQAALRAEFRPISDMRASAGYRQTVLANLLQRFWLDSLGEQNIQLDNLATLEVLA